MRGGRILGGVALLLAAILPVWLVVESLPPSSPLSPQATQTVSGPGPAIPNHVEAPRLPLAEPGVEGSVVRLFRAAIGRDAKPAERDAWVSRYRDGEPLDQIADALTRRPEFGATYGATGDAAYVERLYREVLNRPGDVTDVAHWTAELAGGRSRTSVLLAFAESDEFVARTRTAPPAPPRPLMAAPGVEHSVARVFLGLLGRWPQRHEFDAAVGRYLDGTPLPAIVESVLITPEAAARYDGTSNEAFVNRLYSDVLARPAPPEETLPWRRSLDEGQGRAAVIATFTESDEMVARTRTARPAPAPIRHVLLAVGDSVMRGAVANIESIPGWTVTVDARECRQATTQFNGCDAVDIPSGVDALRTARQAGHLGGVVAIQIGNNGPITNEQFEALMGEVADQRLVLFLTLRLPRDYEPGNNQVIAAGAARRSNARVLDWHGVASRNADWFSDTEGIHLSSVGAQAMADMIAAALPA